MRDNCRKVNEVDIKVEKQKIKLEKVKETSVYNKNGGIKII